MYYPLTEQQSYPILLRTGKDALRVQIELTDDGGGAGAEFRLGAAAWYCNKGNAGARLRRGGPNMDAQESGEIPVGARVRVDAIYELEGQKLRSHICEPVKFEARTNRLLLHSSIPFQVSTH